MYTYPKSNTSIQIQDSDVSHQIITGWGLISSIGHVHPWRPERAVNRVGAGWVVIVAGDAGAKWDSSEQLFTFSMPSTSKISNGDSSSTSIAGNHGDS